MTKPAMIAAAVLIERDHKRQELEFKMLRLQRQQEKVSAELSTAMRNLREASEISLNAMARELELPTPYLEEVETGARIPEVDLVEQYYHICAGIRQFKA